MTIVVDASVAVKWGVNEELRGQARDLIRRRDELTAPDLIHAEVANICWRKIRQGEMASNHAMLLLASIRQVIPTTEPVASLADRALGIAIELAQPAYDAVYLALAEARGGVLITADKRLVDRAARSKLATLVRYLGDWQADTASTPTSSAVK